MRTGRPLPTWVQPVARRIETLPQVAAPWWGTRTPAAGCGAAPQPLALPVHHHQQQEAQQPGSWKIDQLTVNEYLPGVGLAAHVDTHSAFTGGHLPYSFPASGLWVQGQDGSACWLATRFP